MCPCCPGLLYGDREGRPAARRGAERRRRAARAPCPTPRASCAGPPPRRPMPGATGPARPWPPTPSRACRPSTPASRRRSALLHTRGRWNTELLGAHRVSPRHRCPTVVPMGQAAGTLPGSDTVITGGTIDALCDQIVAGADPAGRRPRDLRGHADLLGGLRGVGGGAGPDQLPAHHPGPVPHRRAEQRRRAVRRLGPPAAARHAAPRSRARAARAAARATPAVSPSGCPTCAASGRRSRTTPCAPTSTGSTSGRVPRRSSAPPTRPAAS